MNKRSINGRSRWLLLALLAGALITEMALLAQSPAEAPGEKTAAGAPDTQKPAAADGGRFAPKLTQAEQQIEAALAKPVACKFRELPLSDVVVDLAKQVELPIDLDDKGLEEAGVDRDSPITFETGPLSLRAVLTLLEVRHHLGYVPGLGGLRLTSQEIAAAQENQVLRVYPVPDLLKAPGSVDGDNYQPLIDLISSHVEPDTWYDNGGTGSISGFGGSLVVRQTLAQHHSVASLLAALRKLTPKTAMAVQAVDGPAHAALAKPLSGEAVGTLDDFLSESAQSLKIPIVVSLEGLKNAGAEPTAEVRGKYHEQPGYHVLSQMLRPLHLHAAVFPEFVLVTSEEDASVAEETRLYSVSGLIDSELPLAPSEPLGLGSLDAVVDLVTSTVEPDGWTDNGGRGRMTGLNHPTCLAVTTTYDIHLQIERLLASLRDASSDKAAADRKAEEKIVERVYTLYLPRRQLKAELAKPKADPPAAAAPAPAPAAATRPAAPAAPVPAPAGARPAKPASQEDPFGDLRKQPRALGQFGGMAPMGMGGMGGGYFGPGMRLPAQVIDPIPTADDVAVLIRELLPDASWKEEGVVLKPFHDVLIVHQRAPMLRKIEKLLGDIDAWHAMPIANQRPFVTTLPVVGERR